MIHTKIEGETEAANYHIACFSPTKRYNGEMAQTVIISFGDGYGLSQFSIHITDSELKKLSKAMAKASKACEKEWRK